MGMCQTKEDQGWCQFLGKENNFEKVFRSGTVIGGH